MKPHNKQINAILASGIVFLMLVALLVLFEMTMAATMQAEGQKNAQPHAEVSRAESDPPSVEVMSENEKKKNKNVGAGLDLSAVYMRSDIGLPYGLTDNEDRMDEVFGTGNWDDLRYETLNAANIFSSKTDFIFMEGSDNNADKMEAFLDDHRSIIDNWVNQGGCLLLNASPTEGDGMFLGFGVSLYRAQRQNGSAVDPNHAIFNQPDAAGTEFSGFYLSEGIVAGNDLSPIIVNDNQQIILGEKSRGAGHVLFGGLTLATFASWDQPQHNNLHRNIIHYAATCAERSNVLPVAENVTIIPTSVEKGQWVVPTAGTEISVTYDFTHPEGKPEGETQIRWRRIWKEVPQEEPGLNEKRMVPAGMTIAEELWCVTVTPHDGTQYGQEKEHCAYIQVPANRLPQAENVAVIENPSESDPLTITYDYNDPDKGQQTITDVLWYRDAQLQSAFNGELEVSSEDTFIGEEWCAVVRVHDEEEAGPPTKPKCTIINPPGGLLPFVSNAHITPSIPTASDTLQLNYRLNDLDFLLRGLGQVQIRWYRNQRLQPRFNDKREVEAEFTSDGEKWHATLRPYNQLYHGRLTTTLPVYITDTSNTLPQVSNVEIQPAQPNTNDALRLSYQFEDRDGDAQGNTIIRWYKNNNHIELYDGLSVIPPNATVAGEIWFAVVVPHDGIDYGPDEAARSVLIQAGNTPGNTLPEAREVNLSPSQPDISQSLVLNYTYHDEDGDLEGDTRIEWTQDGKALTRHNGRSTIPYQLTALGQEWCATVTPHDGTDYGQPMQSNCVTILQEAQNTAPMVKNAHILPVAPPSDQNLEVNYTYFDADADPEGDTVITWYRNDIPFTTSNFEDQTVIPAEFTSPNEVWQAVIRPHDGKEYGKNVWTRLIFINNRPQVASASIRPLEPTTHEPLTLEYDYLDRDSHPDGQPQVRWYKNEVHQPPLDDNLLVPAAETSPNERWYATIAAFDDYEYSNPFTTTEIIIRGGLYIPMLVRQPPPRATPTGTAIPTSTPTPTAIPTATATPTPTAGADTFYEENDTPETAFGALTSDQVYQAYPEDQEDWYYFEIEQTTSSVQLELRNYIRSHKGQIVLYWLNPATQKPERVANDGGDSSTRRIPNEGHSDELQDLRPGRYFIRVYTIEKHNNSTLYRLKAEYE